MLKNKLQLAIKMVIQGVNEKNIAFALVSHLIEEYRLPFKKGKIYHQTKK
jgi:hypothetical protein